LYMWGTFVYVVFLLCWWSVLVCGVQWGVHYWGWVGYARHGTCV